MEDRERPDRDDRGPGTIIPGLSNGFLLLYAFGCFSLYLLLLGIFSSDSPGFFSIALPPLFAFILPVYLLFRAAKKGGFAGVLLLRPRVLPALLVGAMIMAAYFPLALVSSLADKIFPVSQEYLEYFVDFKPKGTLDFISKALALVLVVPLAEEMLFRGLVQQTFHYWMTSPQAVVLGAACFAVAHGTPWLMPPLFLLGLFFGYLYARTENLAYPIIAHGLYNLISLVHLDSLTDEDILQYEPSIDSIAAPIVGLLLFIVLLRAFERFGEPGDA